MDIFTAVYYLGIASCGMQGAARTIMLIRKSKPDVIDFAIAILAIIAAGFGGGFTRDISLRQFPVVFTLECQADIIIGLIGATLFFYTQDNEITKARMQQICLLMDTVGLGTFIVIGCEKSLQLGPCEIVSVWSGCATALCGGILSSLLCGVPLMTTLSASIPYRIFTCLGSLLYTLFRRFSTINIVFLQFAMVAYTTFFVLLDSTSWEAFKKMRQRGTNISAHQEMVLDIKVLVLSFAIAIHTPIEFIWTSYNAFRLRIYHFSFCRKIPVWLHCIRQM